MIDTPDGPRFTDAAPYMERSALVAVMVERWDQTRTPNAPRDVAEAEAVAFLAALFEHPPPEPAAA